MKLPYQPGVRIAVINPGGRDPYIDYGEGVPPYQKGRHAPVNFHAFAACTGGAFFQSIEDFLDQRERFDAVLLLIRRRTWVTYRAFQRLSNAGCRIAIAWKECAPHQIAGQLGSLRARHSYKKLIRESEMIWSASHVLPPSLNAVSDDEWAAKTHFIPTPYPLELSHWDYSVPIGNRSGIMIGTREFATPSRRHRQAIETAARLAHEISVPRVTVINTEKKRGQDHLAPLKLLFPAGCLRIIEGGMPYQEYMRELASHRLILQADESSVPGQVAGDALLARTLCFGGNSTIESLVFSDASLQDCLAGGERYAHLCQRSLDHAIDAVSYRAGARRIEALFSTLS